MRMNQRGLTLVEIIIAAVLGVLVAAGTMMAFLTARRISTTSPVETDATFLAQQTIERFRNRIACDDPWYDPATSACDPSMLPAGSQLDPDGINGIPASSLLAQYSGSQRTYEVKDDGCSGLYPPNSGHCVTVTATVHWNPPSP